MKKKISIWGMALMLCAIMFSSCSSDQKGKAIIFDGETQWTDWLYTCAYGVDNNSGRIALWSYHFQTEIGNSLRGIFFMLNTSEPGTYSGFYDASTQKWSNKYITNVYMTLDYDGVPCPKWNAQSATITLHDVDHQSKTITATIEALLVKEGSTDTRNIRVELQNYDMKGQ